MISEFLSASGKDVILVDRNNNLLGLMTDYSDEGKDFRCRSRGLKIFDPPDLLVTVKENYSTGEI